MIYTFSLKTMSRLLKIVPISVRRRQIILPILNSSSTISHNVQININTNNRLTSNLWNNRSLSSTSSLPERWSTRGIHNSNLVDSDHAPSNFEIDSALVYEKFLSDDEAEALLADILKRMRRRRYERGHWDAVITGYKEVELALPTEMTDAAVSSMSLSEQSCRAIERTREYLQRTHFTGINSVSGNDEGQELKWLPCHAIDLKKDGVLSAHVDSVRFSGHIVAGLSLLSPCIMRLRPASPDQIAAASSSDANGDEFGSDSGDIYTEKNDGHNKNVVDDYSVGHVDMYLPPLSLYVLSGVSRYRYTHEILPSDSTFSIGQDSSTSERKQISVQRDQRISVIFRDARQ